MTPELVFTQHLLRRMGTRKVSRADVEVTVHHPDETLDTVDENGEASIRLSRTMYDGRTLKVWIVPPPADGPWIVKSTAWKGVDDDH